MHQASRLQSIEDVSVTPIQVNITRKSTTTRPDSTESFSSPRRHDKPKK